MIKPEDIERIARRIAKEKAEGARMFSLRIEDAEALIEFARAFQ